MGTIIIIPDIEMMEEEHKEKLIEFLDHTVEYNLYESDN